MCVQDDSKYENVLEQHTALSCRIALNIYVWYVKQCIVNLLDSTMGPQISGSFSLQTIVYGNKFFVRLLSHISETLRFGFERSVFNKTHLNYTFCFKTPLIQQITPFNCVAHPFYVLDPTSSLYQHSDFQNDFQITYSAGQIECAYLIKSKY